MRIRQHGPSAVSAVAAVGFSLLCWSPSWAQTAHFSTGAPKLTKSLPDWSGIWERDSDNVWDNRIPPGVPQLPPYNAEYQKRADAIRDAAAARPPGAPRAMIGGAMQSMPGMMTMLFPMDLQLSPRQVTVLTENGAPPRRIYTDGRVHADDTLPSTTGHSVGRWANGELLVDTCCVRADTRLPGYPGVGGPHSDELTIKERFYLRDKKTLVDEITVEDPKAFTKPWTTEKIWYRRTDWESVEYNREENNREALGNNGIIEGDGARPTPGGE